jgi:hypothetical protein
MSIREVAFAQIPVISWRHGETVKTTRLRHRREMSVGRPGLVPSSDRSEGRPEAAVDVHLDNRAVGIPTFGSGLLGLYLHKRLPRTHVIFGRRTFGVRSKRVERRKSLEDYAGQIDLLENSQKRLSSPT